MSRLQYKIVRVSCSQWEKGVPGVRTEDYPIHVMVMIRSDGFIITAMHKSVSDELSLGTTFTTDDKQPLTSLGNRNFYHVKQANKCPDILMLNYFGKRLLADLKYGWNDDTYTASEASVLLDNVLESALEVTADLCDEERRNPGSWMNVSTGNDADQTDTLELKPLRKGVFATCVVVHSTPQDTCIACSRKYPALSREFQIGDGNDYTWHFCKCGSSWIELTAVPDTD